MFSLIIKIAIKEKVKILPFNYYRIEEKEGGIRNFFNFLTFMSIID